MCSWQLDIFVAFKRNYVAQFVYDTRISCLFDYCLVLFSVLMHSNHCDIILDMLSVANKNSRSTVTL